MRLRTRLLILACSLGLASTAAGTDYAVDAAHAHAAFKVSHIGLSWTHGRFKEIGGNFTVDDANPANTKFELWAKIDSLDTDNAQRDRALKKWQDWSAANKK